VLDDPSSTDLVIAEDSPPPVVADLYVVLCVLIEM